MPRADAYFERGRQHAVCQDYGFASPDGDRAVLADGCSSSPDTDIGARLLCRVAGPIANPTRAGRRIVQRADGIREAMLLDPRSMDATLLCVEVDPSEEAQEKFGTVATAVVWGDGAVAARRRDGSVIVYELSCKDSAPPYLSYLLDSGRLLRYAQSGWGEILSKCWGDPSADEVTFTHSTSQDIEKGVRIRFESDFDAILLFTDGYRTGVDARGKVVDPTEVITEMLRVQQGPHALRRRFRMMQRDRGWVFEDDFGVAGLTFLDT